MANPHALPRDIAALLGLSEIKAALPHESPPPIPLCSATSMPPGGSSDPGEWYRSHVRFTENRDEYFMAPGMAPHGVWQLDVYANAYFEELERLGMQQSRKSS